MLLGMPEPPLLLLPDHVLLRIVVDLDAFDLASVHASCRYLRMHVLQACAPQSSVLRTGVDEAALCYGSVRKMFHYYYYYELVFLF